MNKREVLIGLARILNDTTVLFFEVERMNDKEVKNELFRLLIKFFNSACSQIKDNLKFFEDAAKGKRTFKVSCTDVSIMSCHFVEGHFDFSDAFYFARDENRKDNGMIYNVHRCSNRCCNDE